MGICGYFKLLILGEFPQKLFLYWLDVNYNALSHKWFLCVIREENPSRAGNAVEDSLALAVLSTTLVCFGLFSGFGYFFVDLIDDQAVIQKMVEQLRPGTLSLVAFLFLTVIYFGALTLYAWRVFGFKKKLNRFQSDFTELQMLLGTFNLISELHVLANQVMVRLAQDVLTVEANSRSKSTDEALAEIRTRMRKVEIAVSKFGFTTRPWEEYFQEASGKPKPNFDLLLSNARDQK